MIKTLSICISGFLVGVYLLTKLIGSPKGEGFLGMGIYFGIIALLRAMED